jgi:hypothetical protein
MMQVTGSATFRACSTISLLASLPERFRASMYRPSSAYRISSGPFDSASRSAGVCRKARSRIERKLNVACRPGPAMTRLAPARSRQVFSVSS